MSAIAPKADISERRCHVRFVPKADIALRQSISVSGRIYYVALVLADLINVRRL